ncbi:MAG TPA: hypothetical protein VGX70_07405 [Gemmataceae bacterium]|jgi:hypothetical protein|nr:hypothetical protein [Gemmataceae bacterium]
MTLLGKILVFANLVLALFFLALGIGIITNRVDWPGTMKSGPASEVKAGIALKSEEIKNWQQNASLALGRYALAMPELLKAEKERPEKQQWYADQLSILQTGKDTANKPFMGQIRNLVYNKNGQLQLDDKGYPAMQPMPADPFALKPIPEMNQELADTQALVVKEMGKVADLMKEEGRLTLEMNGEAGKTKGLRDLLAEEVAVEKNLQEELEYLRPLRYNRQVESALLLKRQQSLKSRLDELKNVGVASR